MTKRFKKSDWLDFGLAELASNGPEALRVKELCAAADKTIGSFYHHFDDQAAFIDALMEHWHETVTQPVIDALEEIDDAQQRARELSDLATSLDPSIEVNIRLLASQNARVQQAVERVDRQRIAYVTQMYAKRFSIAVEEASLLAKLEYAAFVGGQHAFRGSYTTVGPKLAALLQSALEEKYRE
ncbi:TetR/AcrR family transcriptional regulator [Phaeobacter inhibens]|uniref:TetR/AcrR family transcriptional regulator n=1 Tax=Phaeobacter inhibens TaxID=221822 RepID=UPI0021A7B37B|nr:TetR/AcrR family transcriptional regulator [Phaeobacter inhibens]UWR63029.1 TetR/AcrR family transcriptional regulator [Phaeobacter inhibens]UWR98928.1 TetR/AcrR family transcriptional regulator [Phaeobacter inhibens]UWS02814.1 TetR/AcrR family transcriptional regulator [Phaeobacter inhibens]